MLLRQIFDPPLAQYAYLVGGQKTGEAILIDPERDIDVGRPDLLEQAAGIAGGPRNRRRGSSSRRRSDLTC